MSLISRGDLIIISLVIYFVNTFLLTCVTFCASLLSIEVIIGMNINERIRDLRKSLKLSQEEFGNRLGVTKASISRLESGINNVTEQMIKSVCREYNVNYAWLKEGVGEMFISSDDSVANRIIQIGRPLKK